MRFLIWQKIRQSVISPLTMEDWSTRIDRFLDSDDRPVLPDAGHVTAEQAKEYAETEFEKYRIIQDSLFQSDFDRFNSDNMLDSVLKKRRDSI